MISTIERNPNAFRSKILSSSSTTSTSHNNLAAEVALHHKGCHCKKSNCLKKYCECFQLGITCSDRCRCTNCKNFPGSVERNKCLSVGIKEISQIIRKSENGCSVSDASGASIAAGSSSSSRSASYIAAPDVALVRRLDDLGAILSHDVISKVMQDAGCIPVLTISSVSFLSFYLLFLLTSSTCIYITKVCQSMLLTVFEETSKNNSVTKRKRGSSLGEDGEEGGGGGVLEPPPKKIHVDGIVNHIEVEVSHGSENMKDNSELDGVNSEEIAVDQSKLIVTKLLHAFGMSVLGAVRSLTTHNEVDMSLGIAGLYSLKMEKGRSFENMASTTEGSPDRPKPAFLQKGVTALQGGHVTQASTSSQNFLKISQPFHQFPPSQSQSLPEDLLQSADSSQTDIDQSSNSTDVEKCATTTTTSPPTPFQLSRSNRSMSVNSTTTTEEILSQDSQEENCLTEYPSKHPNTAISHAILQTTQSPSVAKMFAFDRNNRSNKQEAVPVGSKVEYYHNGWGGGIGLAPFEDDGVQEALSGHGQMIAAPGGSIEVLSPSVKQYVTTE